MPRSKGSTFRFYNEGGQVFPFYARDEATAIHIARVWSRRMGIKLYRRRSK